MASLLDVGPLRKEYTVRARSENPVKLSVGGVTAEGFFYLISTFAEIRAIMQNDMSTIAPEAIFDMAQPTVGALLAVGTTPREEYLTYKDWVEAVKAASPIAMRLGAEDQVALLNIIFEYTFSEGAGPFVDQIKRLTSTLGFQGLQARMAVGEEATSARADVTQRATTSPKPSSAAFQTDTTSPHRMTRGAIPRAN